MGSPVALKFIRLGQWIPIRKRSRRRGGQRMAFCPQKIDQIGRRNVVLFQSRVGRGPPTVRIDEDIGWAECKRRRFCDDVLDLFVRSITPLDPIGIVT